MKKLLSLILAAILAASVLASCANTSPAASSTSSDYADEAWLRARIGDIPDTVTVGTADSLGIDMTDFEDDGYIIRTEADETVLCGKTEDGLDRAVRYYAKCVKYGNPVEDVTYHEGYRIERLTIAGRDISEYTVVYTHTDEPTMPDVGLTRGNAEYAAREFVRLIKQATGVELAITADDVPHDTPCVSFEAFDDDTYDSRGGYSYEVKDGNVFFKGNGTNAGCSNGVYYFIEHLCGWEGLTYGDSCLAEAEYIDVPEGTSRNACVAFGHYIQGNLRTDSVKKDRYLYHYGIIAHCNHGLANYRLLGEDFDYIHDQPCFMDESITESSIEAVKDFVQTRIDSGLVLGETLTYVDMGYSDNHNWCNCKKCQKSLKENASVAGPVMHFTNIVSEAVNEEYPGLVYLAFAYLQTKIPPKIDLPNDLVRVTFCLDGVCKNHPINSDECQTATFKAALNMGPSVRNKDFASWLEEWCRISKDVSVWYYVMDGAFAQYSVLDRVLFEDAKYLISLGVYGFYLDGECSGLGVGRMNHLIMPVIQWNPDITYEEYMALLERKVNQSYGEEAYGAFWAAADVYHESIVRNGDDPAWHTGEFNFTHADYEYVGENLDRVAALLDDMIEDAPTYEKEIRAKKLTLALYYEGVAGAYYPALFAGDTDRLAHLSEMYDIFVERSEECGLSVSSFPLGIEQHRSLGSTLDEEVSFWNTCDGVPKG